MTEYDNTNSGALFRNEDKDEEHPNWSDYQGSLNVDGREYYLNAWLKTAKSGKKYMSLSVQAKGRPKASGSRDDNPPDDFDDSIPF